jgi:microcystin-dependent protein
MLEENTFVRDDLLPSWWANAIQKFLSTSAPGFQLSRGDATHIQVIAGADTSAAVISIKGKWRWNEATINRAHPGGAAGTWDIYATAVNNKIDATPAPGTDNTTYAFSLRIVKAGETPSIEAGVVDIFRLVGTLAWSGAEITALTQTLNNHSVPIYGPAVPPAASEVWEPGDLKPTARATAPAGWLLAQGQAVSRATFKALFEAIGTTFGVGDGSTTFNVPDGRGRSMIGSGTAAGDGTAVNHALGSMTGNERVVMTTGQMPKHGHNVSSSQTAHNHGVFNFYTASNFAIGGQVLVSGGGGVWSEDVQIAFRTNTFGATPLAQTGITDEKAPGITSTASESGAGESHPNLAPVFAGNWLIKT